MSRAFTLIGLDIGQRRTGVATADSQVKIAIPYATIDTDEQTFRSQIAELVTRLEATTIVVGYPRNQSGEPTAQTLYVETMAKELEDLDSDIVFQDESLTSVMAEERLKADRTTPKGEIDAEAAAIILQDYMEQRI